MSRHSGDRTSSQPILLSWLIDPIVMPDIRSTATQITQCHNNATIKFLTEKKIALRHVIIYHRQEEKCANAITYWWQWSWGRQGTPSSCCQQCHGACAHWYEHCRHTRQ